MSAFDGQTAIVTGAGSGIGKALSLELARAGASIVAIGTTGARLHALTEEVEGLGRACVPLVGDVTSAATFADARDVALERFGRVDIVVNNAGAISMGLPQAIPLEEWQRVFDVNVMAVVRSNEVFLPLLLEQGSGHIVNVASVDGLYSFGYDRLPYASSKGAVVILSEGLALYLKPRGISVTCFCPGPVATNITGSVRSFGPPVDMHGAGQEYEMLPVEAAAQSVISGMREKRFLVTSHAVTDPIVRRRGEDLDAFIDHQIAHPHILFPAGAKIG